MMIMDSLAVMTGLTVKGQMRMNRHIEAQNQEILALRENGTRHVEHLNTEYLALQLQNARDNGKLRDRISELEDEVKRVDETRREALRNHLREVGKLRKSAASSNRLRLDEGLALLQMSEKVAELQKAQATILEANSEQTRQQHDEIMQLAAQAGKDAKDNQNLRLEVLRLETKCSEPPSDVKEHIRDLEAAYANDFATQREQVERGNIERQMLMRQNKRLMEENRLLVDQQADAMTTEGTLGKRKRQTSESLYTSPVNDSESRANQG